jgi:cysteinyl-tRNA synthetase
MQPPRPLRLHNTLTKRVEDFVATDPSHVTFYTCGPTVYDDAHIGNFRSFLAADVLRRFLESPLCSVKDAAGTMHAGPRRVTHVMNITDVGHMTDDAEGGEAGEDRMAVAGRRLLEAKKAGTLPAGVEVNPGDPYQIARFYEARFREDSRALGLKVIIDGDTDPSRTPRATESIAGMIAVIERLVERGHAYMVGEPGQRVVYFDVKSFPGYGALSGNSLDSLKEGEGGRVQAAHQSQKRSPADFLLWKEDSTHIMKWKSPWGEGYPGWHIECTAMSVSRLRAKEGTLAPEALARLALDASEPIIDVHSGGEDNIFPHHECEIAQSCGAFGTPGHDAQVFARMWFHPRFLLVEGTKMSKSKGNFFTARDLFAKGVQAGALRLELIRTHYRANANFTMQGLEDCQRMIDRWRRVVDAHPAEGAGASAADAAALREHPLCREVAMALSEDLNVSQAVAAVNAWLNGLGSPTKTDADALRMVDGIFGVLSLARAQSTQTEIGVFAPGVTPDAKVEELLRQRRDARAKKDFAASDKIRDELAAMGFAIKDMAGGKVEVRRG